MSDPRNYRPISLLGVMDKLVASFLSESFSTLAERYQLNHDSQIGGLANRQTSDHILHLASLIGGQTSGYTTPPPPPPPPLRDVTPDPSRDEDYLSDDFRTRAIPPP